MAGVVAVIRAAANPVTVHAASVSGPVPATLGRIASIDVTRGLIMVLMALDHVRIYFSAAQFDPVDLDATTPGWFLTRWITHLCAPGFFFLAGLGTFLLEDKAGRAATARYLAERGLLLLALEICVFGFAWSFNPGWFWFGVIWGLGAAMLVMAGAIWLGRTVVLVAGIGFTLIHNAAAEWLRLPGDAGVLLYAGGLLESTVTGARVVLYPLLPWLALMAIGYGSGRCLVKDGRLAVKRGLLIGIAAVVLAMLLRVLALGQGAADPAFDAGDERAILAFLNIQKYPPSLQFSLAMLGLLLVLMALVERCRDPSWRAMFAPLRVFGEVPFFFYCVHLFLIHGLALLVAALLGWPTDYLFWTGVGPNLRPPAGYGFGLAGVYLAWLGIVTALFPPSAAFARLKHGRRHAVLRYF